MKKIVSVLLVLALVFTLSPSVFAADDADGEAAEFLHAMGLFQGKGTDPDGTPVYALEDPSTRSEAITMLVRLLGKEDEALSSHWDMAFTDVEAWAMPYVSFAYANGLTAGTGATTFDGGSLITAAQYLTLILRALGYDSSTDFNWESAWELSDELGITHGEYRTPAPFLRANMAQISAAALSAQMKGSSETLADSLIRENVFTREAYDAVLLQSEATEDPEAADVPADTEPVEDYYSPEAVYGRLIAMKDTYPEGTPWTSANAYTRTDMLGYNRYTGLGCMAFAMILSDAAFGDLPYRELPAGSFTFDSIRVGDILRVENNSHSVVVLEKNEDSLVIAEGSYNDSVHWGRTITKEEAESASYIWTRYPEN